MVTEYDPETYAVTWERIGGMDLREVLLPQMLATAGYRSAVSTASGTSGMSRRFLPLQRGFDEFYGLVNTGIDYFTHERYGVPSMYSGNALTVRDKGTYCTELFEREAVRFVRENKDRPFFLVPAVQCASRCEQPRPREIRSAAQGTEQYKATVSPPGGHTSAGDPLRSKRRWSPPGRSVDSSIWPPSRKWTLPLEACLICSMNTRLLMRHHRDLLL